jgi:hypothetical protein
MAVKRIRRRLVPMSVAGEGAHRERTWGVEERRVWARW